MKTDNLMIQIVSQLRMEFWAREAMSLLRSSNLCSQGKHLSRLMRYTLSRSFSFPRSCSRWFTNLILSMKISASPKVDSKCRDAAKWRWNSECLKLRKILISSLTRTLMTKFRKLSRSSGMTSNLQRTFGLRSSLLMGRYQPKVVMDNHLNLNLLTFTKISSVTQLNNSTVTRWWCSKSSKMSFNNKSQPALTRLSPQLAVLSLWLRLFLSSPHLNSIVLMKITVILSMTVKIRALHPLSNPIRKTNPRSLRRINQHCCKKRRPYFLNLMRVCCQRQVQAVPGPPLPFWCRKRTRINSKLQSLKIKRRRNKEKFRIVKKTMRSTRMTSWRQSTRLHPFPLRYILF